MMLDFNAGQSIHLTGNGNYMMNPVIRVMPVITSGTISGQVLPLDADANVWTLVGADTVSTYPNSGGYFALMALPEGLYDVHIMPNNILYRDTLITDVNVTAGDDTNLGTINLQLR